MQQVLTKSRLLAVVALASLGHGTSLATESRPLAFHVTYDAGLSKAPFNGRVYLLLSRRDMNRPPDGPSWFRPEPFFGRDVRNWKPGEVVVLDDAALGFPSKLSELRPGRYSIMAVMDFQPGERSFAAATGNGYSRPIWQELNPATSGPIALRIDQRYTAPEFTETARVKLVELSSKSLSHFAGRPVVMRAAVILPRSHDQDPDKRYPVIYEIPGFSGTHDAAHHYSRSEMTNVAGTEVLYVVLDPSCHWGHHVFADSENNGPWGKALTEELIPNIEKRFRAVGKPAGRFLTGVSSGGWSSLWLQITYPDFFGGVWSIAPDPVDFRDFQKINIYKPGTNMFVDDQGAPRPIARMQGRPVLFYRPFSDMEVVMGHGGQLFSFEGVFSPRGKDGLPMPLWDRRTGKIDPKVAKSWERYDIRLVLERNWSTLGPKLAGKLHIHMGSEDTFYLEGATILLKDALAKLDSDAEIEIHPGRDHNLFDRELRRRVGQQMAASYRRSVR